VDRFICYLFFKKKQWSIPMSYVWGIRLALLFFVIFALEGGAMAAMLRHTVGGTDGSRGIALLNWSRGHGDLRIAHSLGMHALQLFPLFGYYIAKNSMATKAFAFLYVITVVAVLVEALMGLPLILVTDSRIAYLFYFLVTNPFCHGAMEPQRHEGSKARRNTKKIKKIFSCSFEPLWLSLFFNGTSQRSCQC